MECVRTHIEQNLTEKLQTELGEKSKRQIKMAQHIQNSVYCAITSTVSQ